MLGSVFQVEFNVQHLLLSAGLLTTPEVIVWARGCVKSGRWRLRSEKPPTELIAISQSNSDSKEILPLLARITSRTLSEYEFGWLCRLLWLRLQSDEHAIFVITALLCQIRQDSLSGARPLE